MTVLWAGVCNGGCRHKIMDTTNEFSFVLKPSEHGIGVFAAHGIKAGTFLRLFGDDEHPEESRMLRKEDVPELIRMN